jgi:vacuolar iron transporter family protein
MREALKTGFSFGITSGIITTLGLMVGLAEGTNSKIAVIGGIITIAVADAMSDALGIHVSEESENSNSNKEIWASTFSTFASKLLISTTFLAPVILLPLSLAINISILWGAFLLSSFSYFLAKQNNRKPIKVIAEHLFVATLVIVITFYLGGFINSYFS